MSEVYEIYVNDSRNVTLLGTLENNTLNFTSGRLFAFTYKVPNISREEDDNPNAFDVSIKDTVKLIIILNHLVII
jgi:hypothetical protein